MDNSIKYKTLLKILLIMIVLQLMLFIMKHTIFLFIERTNYSDHMSSMFSMTVISAIILIVSSKKGIQLSLFPEHFGLFYIIVTLCYSALFISTPIITKESTLQSILLQSYGSIITPIFEELIFRGYIWNKLSKVFSKEYFVYIINTILFALWHLGYFDSIAFRTDTGLAHAILWKVITGLCFGIVLGATRLKSKNCYLTFLLHGTLNIFGR